MTLYNDLEIRILRIIPKRSSLCWDRSSAWLERLPVKEEVGGSSPLGPAYVGSVMESITAWTGGTYTLCLKNYKNGLSQRKVMFH